MIFRKVIKSPCTKENMYKVLKNSKIKQLSDNEFAVWSPPFDSTINYLKSNVEYAFDTKWLSYVAKEFLIELLMFILGLIKLVILILIYPINILSYKLLPVKVITLEKDTVDNHDDLIE